MNQESAITDSWEDIDEVELENRLEQERQERTRKEQEMTARQDGFSILSNEDNFRPRILQRPKPAVTILKRPDSSPSLSSTSLQNSKPQMKTLEQREKEYAEARLRILGSAVSDESPTDQNKQFITSKLSPSSSSNSLQSNNQSQQQRNPENVVRLPKGPTPGPGFNIRR